MKRGPRFLIRLDDAHPRMDARKWAEVEALLDARGARPLVGVIPACEDPSISGRSADPRFWDRARAWQEKGWGIGLHGYAHRLRPSAGGLVPLNRYSEFVGLPESEQRDLIRRGYAVLRGHDLDPLWWIAPAHGLDVLTLRALKEETPIRSISDGLSTRPYSYLGFSWFPQQLWKPRAVDAGFWTICVHPDEATETELVRLDSFLAERGSAALAPAAAAAEPVLPRTAYDAAFAAAFLAAKKLKGVLHARS